MDIEIVASDITFDLPHAPTQTLAEEVAQVFGTPPGMGFPSAQCAENGGKPRDVHPVFVTVLRSRVPEGSELENEFIQLPQVVARVLNRPEANFHIFYQPDGAGRGAFGGNLVR